MLSYSNLAPNILVENEIVPGSRASFIQILVPADCGHLLFGRKIIMKVHVQCTMYNQYMHCTSTSYVLPHKYLHIVVNKVNSS